jgi:hypothetical protein
MIFFGLKRKVGRGEVVDIGRGRLCILVGQIWLWTRDMFLKV